MNTYTNNYNISFGQIIPTRLLLRCSLDTFRYQDVKNLVLSQDSRFPGNLGYARKAMRIVDGAIQKNKFIADFVERLKKMPSEKKQEHAIEAFIAKHGINLDIEI